MAERQAEPLDLLPDSSRRAIPPREPGEPGASRRPPSPPEGASYPRRVLVAIGLVLGTGALVGLVVLTAEVLLVLFAGILFAIFLRGLGDWIARHTRLSPRASVGIVLAGLLGLAVLGGTLFAPGLTEQARELGEKLPDLVGEAERYLEGTAWGAPLLHAFQNAGSGGGPRVQELTGMIAVPVRLLAYALMILIMGVYLATSPSNYTRGLVRLVPPAKRARADFVLGEVGKALRWFLLGRVASMLAVGVLTGVGLELLGIPFAPVLGIVAGLLTFVPYAGPIAAGIPIVLVALTEGTRSLVYATLFYAVVQSIEGFLITPLVQERAVKLLPALTLAAEAIFGWLFGPIGVVLSVPLAAALVPLVRLVYVEDVLGDRPGPEKEEPAPASGGA